VGKIGILDDVNSLDLQATYIIERKVLGDAYMTKSRRRSRPSPIIHAARAGDRFSGSLAGGIVSPTAVIPLVRRSSIVFKNFPTSYATLQMATNADGHDTQRRSAIR